MRYQDLTGEGKGGVMLEFEAVRMGNLGLEARQKGT